MHSWPQCWARGHLAGQPHAPAAPLLQGKDFRSWVSDSGAQAGDSIALNRQGSVVLIRLVRAAQAKQPAVAGAAACAAAAASSGTALSQDGSPHRGAPARRPRQGSVVEQVDGGAAQRNQWAKASDGCWRVRLSATACGATASPCQLSLPGELFAGSARLPPLRRACSLLHAHSFRQRCLVIRLAAMRSQRLLEVPAGPHAMLMRSLLVSGRPACLQLQCSSS